MKVKSVKKFEMAQSRTPRIGTIYSRCKALLEKKGMQEQNKPLWYDIYEAFPPKYEPRYDRHLVTFAIPGANVAQMPPPRKILYEEDQIRAKYYKAFMPSGAKTSAASVASSEVFNLLDNEDLGRKTYSQIFIDKYKILQAEGKYSEEDLFTATLDALEVSGINLRQEIQDEVIEEKKADPLPKFDFPKVTDLLSTDTKEKD